MPAANRWDAGPLGTRAAFLETRKERTFLLSEQNDSPVRGMLSAPAPSRESAVRRPWMAFSARTGLLGRSTGLTKAPACSSILRRMMTVAEAARVVGRDPETIRRWVRSGKLKSQKVGTQHVIEERDLDEFLAPAALPMPECWRTFSSGRKQPDWVAAIARSRRGR